MLYIMKPVLQRFLSYVLISRTNAHAVRGRPTLNDVERFRNGPVHELSSLKASQMCKVYTSSHEITNEPYMSSNQNTGKTVTADLKTNYYAEMNTSLAEKIKNVGEHNTSKNKKTLIAQRMSFWDYGLVTRASIGKPES